MLTNIMSVTGRLALLASWTWLVGCTGPAGQPAPEQAIGGRAIDTIVATALEAGPLVGASVSVARGGALVYANGLLDGYYARVR